MNDPFVRLLSGCPVLEDLSFDTDLSDSISIYKIYVPTLKRLSILHHEILFYDYADMGGLEDSEVHYVVEITPQLLSTLRLMVI